MIVLYGESAPSRCKTGCAAHKKACAASKQVFARLGVDLYEVDVAFILDTEIETANLITQEGEGRVNPVYLYLYSASKGIKGYHRTGARSESR